MAEEADKDDKTEEPSQRRLEQAIERGDVAKSQELNSLFVLAAGTLAIMISGAGATRDLALSLRGFLEHAHEMPTSGSGLTRLFTHALMSGLWAVALPLAFVVVAGVGANLAQHRIVLSTEGLTPKLSRLSPLSGLARVFGREALVNFIKGLFKIGVVGAVVWIVMRGERDRLDAITRSEVSSLLPITMAVLLKVFGYVLAVYAFIAMGDFLYQRYTWHQRQRMSRQELKDEYKETEGSPEIKGRLAKIRRERAKQRMMAAVPKASVVITNPTHYAVALRYERGMAAPVCVAKGVDLVALRIREIANDHRIPIMENRPLARALHKAVEIDDEIPEEHYKAVAEIIGLVMRLRSKAGAGPGGAARR